MLNKPSVLYRDNQLAVAVKPYGVLSEDGDQNPGMPALLKAQVHCESIYTVHRLDRTTQGVMVYALSKEAASRLSAQIQRGEMEKIYLAVVEGSPESCSGELSDLLYFDHKKNKSFVVKRERRGVKDARLRYEVLKTAVLDGQQMSLIKICLLTGRTHQIRVQFASRSMPLVGDRRYGSRIPCDHIMLCSSELCFTHPVTGERMLFSFSPDNDFFHQFKE